MHHTLCINTYIGEVDLAMVILKVHHSIWLCDAIYIIMSDVTKCTSMDF